MSAVESYNQVLEKFHGDPRLDPLARIRDNHMSAAGELMKIILASQGTLENHNGSWDRFSQGLQAVANLFGRNSAVEVLRMGEEHGRKLSEKARDDGELPSECRRWIREVHLPQLQRHLQDLERVHPSR